MRIRRKRQDRTAVGRTLPAKGPTFREAALAVRIADLEAELRARDDFLAIAAHEPRNPMTPISARLELLLARARHMSEGVPAGLEVARASSEKLKLQITEVDLSTLIRQVTANMLPLTDSAGCEVRLNCRRRGERTMRSNGDRADLGTSAFQCHSIRPGVARRSLICGRRRVRSRPPVARRSSRAGIEVRLVLGCRGPD
jgi:signal transduction histidine kinase